MEKFIYLIACEESGSTFNALYRKYKSNPRVEVYSCDLKPASEKHECKARHLQMDARKAIQLIKPNCLIGHPPCTYFTRAGAQLMFNKDHEIRDWGRWRNMLEYRQLFMDMWRADVEHICLENPIPMHCCNLPQYSQIIDPWYFGEPYTKLTCLWLKNLPELNATKVYRGIKKSYVWTCSGSEKRSKSFKGISEAVADQWGYERIEFYKDMKLF